MTVAFAVPDVLVARAQAGDEEALEALYRAFETPVYNLVRRMLRRPEDAEDVVQETFLEVVRNIKQYRGEGHLWGWIRKIASTKALMRIRRGQGRRTAPRGAGSGQAGGGARAGSATTSRGSRGSTSARTSISSARSSGCRRRRARSCGCMTSKDLRTRKSRSKWEKR